jgi:hypothetical protein
MARWLTRGGRRIVPVLVALASASAGAQIYSPQFTARVTVHPVHAACDAPPMRLVGSNTTLTSPRGVAVDTGNGELFVTHGLSGEVTVFRLGANGDAVPLRRLFGAATQLGTLSGLAVDATHDELVVRSSNAVRVFARGAAGNTPPLRSIAGPQTQIDSNPRDVALDLGRDQILVTHWDVAAPATSAILAFARTASGDVAPLRVIAGPATGITEIHGIAFDPVNDEIFVACATSIRVFAGGANGDVAPLRVVAGPATGLAAGPEGLALDLERDEVAVGVSADHAIRTFPRAANGDVAPTRSLVGAATGFAGVGMIDLVPQIFADGFQSGDLAAWSLAAP